MKIDITRQSLITSLITMLGCLTLLYVGVECGDNSLQLNYSSSSFLGHYIVEFQSEFHLLSMFISGAFLLSAALTMGRITSVYGLFTSQIYISLPLYIICSSYAILNSNMLLAATIALLATRALNSLIKSIKNEPTPGVTFDAALYMGVLPLLAPATIALWLVIPVTIVRAHRTLNEFIVAIAGLLLPATLYLYIYWALGGSMIAPISQFWYDLTAQSGILHNLDLKPISLTLLCAQGALILISLVGFMLSNGGTPRARARIFIAMATTLIAGVAFAIPSCDVCILAAAAPSVILLLTNLLSHINKIFSLATYILIFAIFLFQIISSL